MRQRHIGHIRDLNIHCEYRRGRGRSPACPFARVCAWPRIVGAAARRMRSRARLDSSPSSHGAGGTRCDCLERARTRGQTVHLPPTVSAHEHRNGTNVPDMSMSSTHPGSRTRPDSDAAREESYGTGDGAPEPLCDLRSARYTSTSASRCASQLMRALCRLEAQCRQRPARGAPLRYHE